MQYNRKAQGQWGLIVKAAIAVLLIIIGYFFINEYLLERGGGAIEEVGLGPLKDADGDGIKNMLDKCCAPKCATKNYNNTPVEQFGDLMGCIKDKQGPTTCDATSCNPALTPEKKA